MLLSPKEMHPGRTPVSTSVRSAPGAPWLLAHLALS